MDVLEAIITRRSIRQFLRQPVKPELLEQVLEAARWAPSAGNRQRWRFVVVQDRSLVQLVKRLSPGISSVPPCIIAVCSDPPGGKGRFDEYLSIVDCAMATQNMLLAAHALGLGACVVRSFSSAGIRELLGLPDGVEPELLVTLGYPRETPEAPPRRPLSEVVFKDRYGARQQSDGKTIS